MVRQDDGSAGARVAHHRHFHGANALAHTHHAIAEGEDAGVVVIQDGHRGDQGLHQAGFGRGAHLVALEHALGVAHAKVEEAHEEVLVLLEYVVVDDANLEKPMGVFKWNTIRLKYYRFFMVLTYHTYDKRVLFSVSCHLALPNF